MPQRPARAPALGDSTLPRAAAAGAAPRSGVGIRFRFDQTADGRVLKLLNIVDELTRESLAMLVYAAPTPTWSWTCFEHVVDDVLLPLLRRG